MVKIEAAKQLIQHSNDSISVIMEKVGFLDFSYFSKLFKRIVGYSPQSFRNIYNKKNNK